MPGPGTWAQTSPVSRSRCSITRADSPCTGRSTRSRRRTTTPDSTSREQQAAWGRSSTAVPRPPMLAPDRREATAQQVVAPLAAAALGNPEDPTSWITYTQLAPRVLVTDSFGDDSPPAGSWSWTPPVVCTPKVTVPPAGRSANSCSTAGGYFLARTTPTPLPPQRTSSLTLLAVGEAEQDGPWDSRHRKCWL